MRILSLGHSSFLVEMENGDGETIRILGDPWLSDYAIGDLMGRFPRVRIDYSRVPEIHGIYLTHSHTDHLCPYSLIELWKSLPNQPMLLLPHSLQYLTDVFEKYLPGVSILVLEDNRTIDFFDLDITALFNREKRSTNEDDVMLLLLENGSEILLVESDALLPFYDAESRDAISAYLGGDGEGLDTVVFLTTKNELGATMASLHAQNLDDRVTFVAGAEDRTQAEIAEIYTPMDSDAPDLWDNDRLVRLIGGQGLCYPQAIDPDWNRVLFPITVAERVEMERSAVEEYDLAHQVEEFVSGYYHVLEDGELVEREPCGFLELLDDEEDREYDPELELFEDFPVAPLVVDERDYEAQERKILEILNTRFLPYLIGYRQPPIEHLLTAYGGAYVVRVRYGTPEDWEDRDYEISFGRLRFGRSTTGGTGQEWYWANDLDDYLEGRADDFSTFCRHPLELEASERRLWDCLGMPYLNDDLVRKKVELHFELAQSGKSVEDWVLPFYAVEVEDDDDDDDDEDEEDDAEESLPEDAEIF